MLAIHPGGSTLPSTGAASATFVTEESRHNATSGEDILGSGLQEAERNNLMYLHSQLYPGLSFLFTFYLYGYIFPAKCSILYNEDCVYFPPEGRQTLEVANNYIFKCLNRKEYSSNVLCKLITLLFIKVEFGAPFFSTCSYVFV